MYGYNDLLRDVARFRRSGLTAGSIGKTVLGADIPYIHIGNPSGNQAIIQAAIHAREHITAPLAVGLLDRLSAERPRGLQTAGMYFIPMSNIDGARLSQEGAGFAADPERRDFLRKANGGSNDFSLWKANMNAVDLNCNFPARWSIGAENGEEPAPGSWPGTCPASEPETRALIAFTLKIRPKLTVSYHCKGQEIYWRFHQPKPTLSRDRALAEELAAATGYALVSDERGSAGGYKDWCVEALKIPAFTVEIAPDACAHPVPYSVLPEELERNRAVPEIILRYIA